MKCPIHFELNGLEVDALVAPGDRLLDLLRDALRQTGTKEGCGEGECGACSVIVDGRLVNSCLYPAIEADGRRVLTVEGVLRPGSELSPVQRAFLEGGGVQCGFCSPGMIMATVALLERSPNPSDGEIIDALTGNLCRCTGYVQIMESIKRAAALVQEEQP
ncbi:MAG: (2Fe-2S)-binding protein [Deltaproteobacteria bacterium]|nr:(2Fe-2S)-binding protein [Deltaproteobacteria bacterium]